jgi:hypothetical protein
VPNIVPDVFSCSDRSTAEVVLVRGLVDRNIEQDTTRHCQLYAGIPRVILKIIIISGIRYCHAVQPTYLPNYRHVVFRYWKDV